MIRTVFFSDLDSPFGVPHLFELLETGGCRVVGVVVGPPDRSETGGKMTVVDRWGRGISRDLLATCAAERIPVLQPRGVRSPEFHQALRDLTPDLLLSAGFRRILPPEVLEVPVLAAVNLHPSRLPRVRGCNPWFWNVATGETCTAVTAHHMVEAVDAGDLIFQVSVTIDPEETASSLRHKTTVESLRLLAPLMAAASTGVLPRQPQDLAAGSIYQEPTDADRTLDWSAPASMVHQVIRASQIRPGAVTRFGDHAVRVLTADLGTDQALVAAEASPGAVLKVTPAGVAVKAGDGHIVLRQLEADGCVHPAAMIVGLLDGNEGRKRFC